MMIVTTNDIPGYRIESVLGEVMGLTVRTRDAGSRFVAGFRAIGGGELPELTKSLYEGRQEVMQRMVAEALNRGANAVVATRFDTSAMDQLGTEVCAVGTAVIIRPLAVGEPGSTQQSEAHAAQLGHPQG
ncbi:heavy metal-binding domain-containing protein [Klugiella xanthotipulae]|uniref:UPF0145 protein FB466_0086 n=1 Tax=Klugiella xanthotipulae TaxID=244735 RepID=A0A543I3W8_9MICO|nr:YbjQ family protein [Klugiella xanthotipulae]TQM65292.1 uncharacterized protein YbjQ (UPF0145 family) [Klugiella xanthotipulae]